MLKPNYNKTAAYLCAFGIPTIIMLFIYALLGVYPFGDATLLRGDMSVQYIGFLSAFADIIKGEASPFYTFGKVLGGEMIGFGAYYLYSPFNFITLLFSKENLPIAVTIITLLKIGCCGLTMNCYLRSKLSYQNSAVFFSVCYALMAYNAAYQLNIMWLDGVILLPLVILGLERLYSRGKWCAYSIFLAMSLIFNYYTGYMLCLFSVLYFISLLISEAGQTHSSIRSCLQFIGASVIAGGLSAVVLLPTAISLQGGKAEFSLRNIFDFQLNFLPLTFLAGFFPKILPGNAPNIFCGSLIFIGVLLFFFSKNLKTCMKLGTAFLFITMYLSMLFYGIDRLWHGTAVPAGSPYRYSFIFSFLMLQAAYLWYESCSPRINWIYRKKGIVFLVLFTTFELTLNSYLLLDTDSEPFSDHHAKIQELDTLMSQLPEASTTFYRTEILPKHCLNDPMHLNYNGLTSYSSSEQTRTKTFAAKMGINAKDWWINFTGETPMAIDSLLNLKYLIADRSFETEYIAIDHSENFVLYENPHALPIGFMADEAIYQVNMYQEQSIIDVFDIQNQIWKTIGDSDAAVFHAVTAQETVREDNCVEYEFTPENEEEIFTNVHNEMLTTLQVWVNGELRTEWKPERQIYSLGTFRTTDTVRVRVESTQNINWYDLFFYFENKELIINEVPDIRQNGYQVKEFNGNYFRGSAINTSSQYEYLLLTIPFDKGWEIFVDGTKVDGRMALDCLLSVPIAPGAHEVILHFVTPGLKVGLYISSLCCGIILLLLFISYKKEQKTKKGNTSSSHVHIKL